ncbi:Gfo/Idh/MocA family protein [Glacieibacterium frigidum]|uniref:Gfo/Idh/MocA family oxidoreductase n=1 Tax=Glacieibacterium frigidum TaxID=2593303 RepID=A0A552UJL9_9SPHN|nr:Gfo/Idh/MocA family oxidoreductase [Glacieibacterium frigidum]TRW18380.1 Gfo/Idh/MocA family oxidoreductase [Glacieibacterium frigidum]
MAGGGEGAFIGAVHRMAARLDGEWTLVAGAFSADAARNERSGASLGLDPARTYARFDEMIAAEAALPLEQRMQALVIATPNHLHRPMAIAALEAGIAVLSDKPMALDLREALDIAAAAARSGAAYGVTYTYAGYPMVAEMRARIAGGDFGAVRQVAVEYRQGWLSTPADADGNKQAEWRTDPARAGQGGALGDIGTHAFHLAEHVTGLRVETLCADLTAHVPGRRLDDDASVLLRFAGGARGTLTATQIAAGEENGLRLRVACERATIEWRHDDANSLTIRWLDRPLEVVRTGGPGVSAEASALTRTPAGHPEGYIEAFANLYRGFAAALRGDAAAWYPGIDDGVRGMAFVATVVANARGTEKWTAIDDVIAAAERARG